MEKISMEDIVNYCKQYGFVYQGSEIYDGLANTWDYGIIGSLLINNIKEAWKKRFVQERRNSYLIDAGILMHPRVWEASGHLTGFSDPQVDCKECKKRYRADQLISDTHPDVNPDLMSKEELQAFIKENVKCPHCGKSNFTDVKDFDLMFKTFRGTTDDNKMTIYLRPETCQGQYINFLNVMRSSRSKLPMSIAQIGKSFRNEVTPGNFIFRTIEFEQMEHQTFCKPEDAETIYNNNKETCMQFLLDLGVDKDKLRFKDHDKLVFYAAAACDIQYNFPIGWEELQGIHNRTNYDLTQHSKFSGVNMDYLDPETNEKYTPYVLETSVGTGRLFLTFICDAYKKEELENGEEREVLKIHPFLAPYKVCVTPLIKKVHGDKANEIYNGLSKHFMCTYDDTQSIGKRYRRQDIIGTPFVLTVDDNTLENNTVTLRDRDTMEQVTLNVNDVANYVEERIKF